MTIDLGSRPAVEISGAVTHLYRRHVGRGPANLRTTISRDLVVSVFEGGLTRAERTLIAAGRPDLVGAGRAALHEVLRESLVAAVEQATSRTVLSAMCTVDAERDLQAVIFVLQPDDDRVRPDDDGHRSAGTPVPPAEAPTNG